VVCLKRGFAFGQIPEKTKNALDDKSKAFFVPQHQHVFISSLKALAKPANKTLIVSSLSC
jgi:hypothetical protein